MTAFPNRVWERGRIDENGVQLSDRAGGVEQRWVEFKSLRKQLSEAVRDGKAGEVKRLTRLCFALPKQNPLLNKCSDSTTVSSEKEG